MTEQPQASSDDEPVPPPSSSPGSKATHRVREDPVLPSRTSDEDDRGWGDDSSGRDDEWYLRERPPHH